VHIGTLIRHRIGELCDLFSNIYGFVFQFFRIDLLRLWSSNKDVRARGTCIEDQPNFSRLKDYRLCLFVSFS
jgi:hypothetical protein